jgi:zinc transporter, ZIP family
VKFAAPLFLALASGLAGCGGSGDGDLAVTQSKLQPGAITLVVRNESEESERVSQVILNDAFVDFRASARTIPPNDVEAFVVLYPWIRGENYDIRLMTSSGRTVDYEIEEAAA